MSFEFFIDQASPDLEPAFLLRGIGDIPLPSGGGGSGVDLGKQTFDAATLGLDAIIPGLGLALRSAWGIFGGSWGSTPTLDWEEYSPIAKSAAAAVSQEYQAKGVYDKLNDGSFHQAALNFVSSHNPGRDYERGGIHADMNADPNVYGDLFRSLSYQLSGVSRDPNDVTGIQWRVNQWLEDLVLPQMQAAGGGGGGSILPTVEKLKEGILAGDSKSLLTVGAVLAGITGIVLFFKSK